MYFEEEERLEDGSTRTLGWSPAVVIQVGGGTVDVKTDTGDVHTVPNSTEHLLAKSLSATQGIQDMISMDVLHVGALQENIFVRYCRDEIYTYVGPILLSVNPYKWLPIYDPHIMESFMGGHLSDFGPHIYAIAERAYTAMVNEGNQSVLISGESGAGKTEATKIVLQYLMQRAQGEGSHIQQQILDANPVLEAFGNAKTIRNNNSSRFGKFFEVQFDKNNKVIGGIVTKYLLEKSRVVTQADNERNYHVFYYLSRGATDEEREALHILDPDDYTYLDTCTDVDDMDDAEEMENVRKAMDVVGVTKKEQNHLLRLLSGVMLLGNVGIEEDDNKSSSVASEEELATVAELFGVDVTALKLALTFRTMSVAGGRRKSVHKIPLDQEKAYDSRDALAKEIYGCLFDWLVSKVNKKINSNKGIKKTIGVLDIFGFEVFENNSFEQLCINYANEKLHQQFIAYYFKHEQAEYKSEGIDISQINYQDNRLCLDLIEQAGKMGKWAGILSLLQEECRLRTATDKSFVSKVNNSLKDKPHFIYQRFDPLAFGVGHFAGAVKYNAEGFLEKNKDTIYSDIVDVILNSKDKFLQKEVITFSKSLQSKGNTKSLVTVGSQFKEQVGSLVTTLNKTTPNYIRCIKPNAVKEAQVFHGGMVLEQLMYSGVLESIEIRRAGYAMRLPFKDFINRFGIMAKTAVQEEPEREACKAICAKAKLDAKMYSLGRSKIFLKTTEEVAKLEVAILRIKQEMAVKVQTAVRAYCARVRFGRVKAAAALLNRRLRGWVRAHRYRKMKGASIRIQAAYKGYAVRLMIGPLLADAAGNREAIHQLLEESEAKKGDPAEKAAGQLLQAAKAEELEFQEVDDILLDVGDLNLEDLDVNAPEVKEILTQIALCKDPDELLRLRKKLNVQLGKMKLKPQGPAKILREVNMKKPVLKQGWLLKCNASNTLHRVRYCVLVPGRLLCYSGVECAYVNSEFRLQDCEVELVDDLVVPDNIYTKAFGVATGRHNVLFAAPTLKDRADWVAGIKESGEYGSATDPNGAGILVRVGWLYKYNSNTKSWTKFYFVLKDEQLAFFADERCAQQKGLIILSTNCSFDLSDATRATLQSRFRAPTGWCMNLYTGNNQVYLCSDSESALQGWVRDMKSVCSRFKKDLLQTTEVSPTKGQGVSRQGWVWYLKGKKWVLRYAVLDFKGLTVFFDDNKREAIHTIDVQGASALNVGASLIGTDNEVKQVSRFTVRKDGDLHEFATTDQTDLFTWVVAVNEQGALTKHSLKGVDTRKEGWLALGTFGSTSLVDALPRSLTLASGRVLSITSWKAVYCVLAQDRITMFSDTTYNELMGEIAIRDCKLSVSGLPMHGQDLMLQGFDFVFEVMVHRGGAENELHNVVFASETEDAMWDWAAKIDSAKAEAGYVSSGAGPVCIKQGWLKKEAKFSKSWLNRYFVLYGSRLLYYSGADCSLLKGEINLEDAIVRKQPDYMPGVGGVCGNQFSICTPRRVLELAAEDSDGAQAWVAVIEDVMDRQEVLAQPGDVYMEDFVQVYFSDSSSKEFMIGERTTASELVGMVGEEMGLLDNLHHFAVIELTNDKTMRVLQEKDNVSQMVRKWNQQAAATVALRQNVDNKKLLFMKVVHEPGSVLSNSTEIMLEYAQAIFQVRNHLVLSEEEALGLSALQILVDYPDEKPQPGIIADNFHRYVPIIHKTTTSKKLFEWECSAMVLYSDLRAQALTTQDAMLTYIKKARRSPLYGSMFYDVSPLTLSNLPPVVKLAVNFEGVHVVHQHTNRVLVSYDYLDIERWGFTKTTLTLVLGSGAKIIFKTGELGQGLDITLFIRLYVKILARSY